jgi:CBS domain-containing protein
MIISSILRRKGSQVVAVSPEDSIAQVARTLAQHRIGAALVQDADGTMLGIISERDIVRGMASQGQGTSQLPARQLMTGDVLTITPQSLVGTALALMTDRRVRHLPVFDEGKLIGMVSIGDLVKARIEEAEHEAEALKHYVVSGG